MWQRLNMGGKDCVYRDVYKDWLATMLRIREVARWTLGQAEVIGWIPHFPSQSFVMEATRFQHG